MIHAARDLFARSVEAELRGIAATDAVEPRSALEAESLVLALHLVDRWALSRLGSADRELVMSGIHSVIAARLSAEADERMRNEYTRAQKNYGKFARAFVEEGGISPDTLCWEVGKLVSSEFAHGDPARVASASLSAVETLAFVYNSCDEISGTS